MRSRLQLRRIRYLSHYPRSDLSSFGQRVVMPQTLSKFFRTSSIRPSTSDFCSAAAAEYHRAACDDRIGKTCSCRGREEAEMAKPRLKAARDVKESSRADGSRARVSIMMG